MDRRYYGLKALILAVGIAIAVVSSVFGAGPLISPTAHIQYSAAASVELAMRQTTAKVSHAIGKFISGRYCVAPGGL